MYAFCKRTAGTLWSAQASAAFVSHVELASETGSEPLPFGSGIPSCAILSRTNRDCLLAVERQRNIRVVHKEQPCRRAQPAATAERFGHAAPRRPTDQDRRGSCDGALRPLSQAQLELHRRQEPVAVPEPPPSPELREKKAGRRSSDPVQGGAVHLADSGRLARRRQLARVSGRRPLAAIQHSAAQPQLERVAASDFRHEPQHKNAVLDAQLGPTVTTRCRHVVAGRRPQTSPTCGQRKLGRKSSGAFRGNPRKRDHSSQLLSGNRAVRTGSDADTHGNRTRLPFIATSSTGICNICHDWKRASRLQLRWGQ